MNLRRLTSFLALSTPLALQTGCGVCEGGEFFKCYNPPAAATASESDSTAGTDSTADTNPTTAVTTTVTSGMSMTETMGTTEPPPCNMNGICDEGESPQSCANDCEKCGDGVLDEGEICDEGENNSSDNAWHDGDEATAPCNSSCTGKVPFCGDTVCDPPDENSLTCPDDGCVAACGDGLMEGNEACDDGNLVNTDACLNDCQPASCGDGFVQDGFETCDDGNKFDTDACVTCTLATCGDGITWAGMEDCDDANTEETDTCDSTCKTIVHRKVFVSSIKYTGNLGGLSGADIRCQTLADSAGVPGTFKAWLSDDTSAPTDRFDTSFGGVYELVNGTSVAHGWKDLTDGSLENAINATEKNSTLDTIVWTNTTPMGQPLGAVHCAGWTSALLAQKGWYGFSSQNDTTWTDALEGISCGGPFSVYCFEDPA